MLNAPTPLPRRAPGTRTAPWKWLVGVGAFFLVIFPVRITHAQDTRGFLARFLQPNGTKTTGRPNAPSSPAVPANSAALSAPIRPDPKLTPGDILDVTLDDIKTPGYSAKVRNVPVEVKRGVYASYGIRTHAKGEYEVDHLIALSLGGSNSTKNLWPESYLTNPWNAHVKDALEYRLLTLVRAGKVDLRTAQQEMARDWIAAYKKYVGPEPGGGARNAGAPNVQKTVPGLTLPPSPDRQPDVSIHTPVSSGSGIPTSVPSTAAVPKAGQPAAKVWVNTRSGVYHGSASRYYGKTKEGKYLTEAEALAAGFHAAPGKE